MNRVELYELMGKTIIGIEGMDEGSDHVLIETLEGDRYRMFHYQDCCESVYLADVIGDPEDLIAYSPITMAEETGDSGHVDYGTFTWTFYKLATVKGYVTLRWYGESNGYYSESVDIEKLQRR